MSLFGEIVEPSSRAVLEDWDDGPGNYDTKFKWKNETGINEEIDTFYILEGKSFKYFVNIQFQQLQHVNTINELDLNVYKIKSNSSIKYVCTVKDLRWEDFILSGDIIEMLLPYLKSSKNVIAIKIAPISEYQSCDYSIPSCVLRGIYTRKASSTEIDFPKLERPNLLSGFSAAVISVRDRYDLPGTAVICFVEDNQSDEIKNLLNKLGIGSIFEIACNTVSNSNLYI